METYERLRKNNVSLDNAIKNIITSIHFSCIGNVSKVYGNGKRIDVTLPYMTANNEPIVLKGAEVLRPGTHKVRVTYTPEVGDVAIVFAMQNYYKSGSFGTTPQKMQQCPFFDKYGVSTLKAILVQTNEDNDEAVHIDIGEKITIDCPNIEVELNAKSLNVNNGHLTVDVN